MKISGPHYTSVVIMLTALALSCTPHRASAGQRGVPATNGILNFGQVDATLWRGAQPDDPALATLKKLGVATIINLRMPGDVSPTEEATVRRLGLAYINVPLPGLDAPDDASVTRLLTLISTSPGPVFIHCEHGADRTGTIVACYRIRHDGWSTEKALAEAKRYGLSSWEFSMIHFIKTFGPNATVPLAPAPAQPPPPPPPVPEK